MKATRAVAAVVLASLLIGMVPGIARADQAPGGIRASIDRAAAQLAPQPSVKKAADRQVSHAAQAAYGGGGDVESNHDAILGAARYLAANGGRRGDMHDALYRYNPTEKYVRAVTRYAERMKADPATYRGYWGWQVYYWSTLGDVWLRPGWSLAQPRPVTPADLR